MTTAATQTDNPNDNKEAKPAGDHPAGAAAKVADDGGEAGAAAAAAAAKAKVDEPKGTTPNREAAAKEIVEMLGNEDVYKDGLFFGKFKTLEEAGKSLKHLNGKLAEKAPKAPEEYDVAQFKIEGVEGFEFDPEHPLSQVALPFLKKMGASQEQANELIAAAMKAQWVDPEAELKKINPDRDTALAEFKDVKSFIAAKLPQEMHEVADRFVETADGVKMVQFFMKMNRDREIPDTTGAPAGAGKNWQQQMDEAYDYKQKHADTIGGDPGQQAEYKRLMSAAAAAKLKAQGSK